MLKKIKVIRARIEKTSESFPNPKLTEERGHAISLLLFKYNSTTAVCVKETELLLDVLTTFQLVYYYLQTCSDIIWKLIHQHMHASSYLACTVGGGGSEAINKTITEWSKNILQCLEQFPECRQQCDYNVCLRQCPILGHCMVDLIIDP